MSQKSFLYVEDDPFSREIMKVIMEMGLGITSLTTFEDSRDFMARVKALPQPPAVILLDIHVRPHDGFEMLRMLHSDPDYATTCVVALTASVMNEEVEKLRLSGFHGAIAKPLSVQTFPALLTRMMRGEAVWYIN